MADRATADRVAADMKPPNYRGAVQRLRTIKPKKERIASINGEIGGIFDTVEGFKVNKKAARIFMALDGLEPDEQQDIFRSLTGLIDAAGWSAGDLVDAAEGGKGNIVTPNFGQKKGAGEAPKADLDDTLKGVEQPSDDRSSAAAVVTPEEQAKRDAEFDQAAPPPESPKAKRERLKAEAAAGEAQEPFTGDNTDLAPE